MSNTSLMVLLTLCSSMSPFLSSMVCNRYSNAQAGGRDVVQPRHVDSQVH